jgi:hypothetical protein
MTMARKVITLSHLSALHLKGKAMKIISRVVTKNGSLFFLVESLTPLTPHSLMEQNLFWAASHGMPEALA